MTAQRGRPYSGPAPMTPAATAGLRQRREARGLPTGSTPRPLDWWEVIELQTCRDLAAMRRKGLV
jgi:hypothetical protein